MPVNRQVILAAQPIGMPRETDFRLTQSAIPRPGAGEALVRALYLSTDPGMRARMSAHAPYGKAIQPGDVVTGSVVGQVVASNDPRVAPDDVVLGLLGWEDYSVAAARSLRKIDPDFAPISTALHVLGTPGLTAYFGLLEISRPQAGETVVVSAAAGGVGSLVGQIARIKRCRPVGITGSDEKVRFLTGELGFGSAFNYKESSDYYSSLKELCPNGIDVYFDNVGGPITDAAMRLINIHARIAVCGQISQYNSAEPPVGPRWLSQLVVRQSRVEGFLVQQFADRYGEGWRQLSTWLRDKRIQYREDVIEGLESAPRAFIGMLEGRNIGKQLVKVGELARSRPVAGVEELALHGSQ